MRCSASDVPSRREFFWTVGAAGLGATVGLQAAPHAVSETLVTQLYASLSAKQKQTVAFPFDHPLRSKVDANWRITPAKIVDLFNRDQQAMILEIFQGLHNPEFVDKVFVHLEEDGGGIGSYHVALFGEPGTGAFEFVMTGRHCTARCDGDSVAGAAFGGPIFYGHASEGFYEKPDHPGNVYWYQAKRANEVFQALNGKQRELALLEDARRERSNETVAFKAAGEKLAGLPVSEMSPDQKNLVEQVLNDLLLPFRKKDTDEAMKYIRAQGGVDSLAMSFYKNLDIGNDGVWDVWQLEGPKMVWYFRGSPHVHTWVNIRA